MAHSPGAANAGQVGAGRITPRGDAARHCCCLATGRGRQTPNLAALRVIEAGPQGPHQRRPGFRRFQVLAAEGSVMRPGSVPTRWTRAGATMASASALDVMAVRGIVVEELAARAPVGDACEVASTVLALQARAAEVVEAETARLGGKLGGLDTRRMPRSPGPSTGWRTTCCTRRQHGSNSWPDPPSATPTRQRCVCFSISTQAGRPADQLSKRSVPLITM